VHVLVKMMLQSEFIRGFAVGFVCFSIMVSSIILLIKTHNLKSRVGPYGGEVSATEEQIRRETTGDAQQTESDESKTNWLDFFNTEEAFTFDNFIENNSTDFNLTIKRMHLLIIVHSSLQDANSVDKKILSTWGSDKTSEYIIVTGKSDLASGKLPPSVIELGCKDFLSPFHLSHEELGFLMLKIRQFYIDSYWWFLIVPPNTYVSVHYLNKLLVGLDPNVPVYAGHPIRTSRGKKSMYCKAGPGVVLSKTLLQLIDKKISSCITGNPQISSDMALGYCLGQHLKINCNRNNVSIHSAISLQRPRLRQKIGPV